MGRAIDGSPRLGLGFATFERHQAAQRLVLSARKYFRDIPIYAADQSRNIDPMREFYAANDVSVIRVRHDAGVAAARNQLAHQIKEEYFLLCDDDFVIGPDTRFSDAIHILDRRPEIGVVGGRLFDFDGTQETVRTWEMYLEHDVAHRILFSIPIYNLAPRISELGRVRFYLCDAVMNFAVFRRSMFGHGVAWDEQFTCNGEHEDFFLNLKANSGYKVAYLPAMAAYHHHPHEYRTYVRRLRDRNEGWKRFLDKWGLEQHVELGLGVRTVDDVSRVTTEQESRSRFFVNPNLSLRRAEPASDMILVANFEQIATVDALDRVGNRLSNQRAVGHLLVNSTTKEILAPAAAAEGARRKVNDVAKQELLERYGLEYSGQGVAVTSTTKPIYFRYEPMLRADADFCLWYTCRGSEGRGTEAGDWLVVVVRWTSRDGSCLVWRSRRAFLDLHATEYWRPILLDVPPRPRGCGWVRFDVIVDAGARAMPICSGFLFDGSGPPVLPIHAADSSAREVLGLCRVPGDGAVAGERGGYLEDIGRACPKLPITVHPASACEDLAVLSRRDLAGVEALFFTDWQGLGRTLVSARLPPAKGLNAPDALALPWAAARSPRSRLYGYGPACGFLQLVVETGLA